MSALTPKQMRELADEAHLGMVGMIVQIEGEWGHGTSIEELRERGDEDVLLADKVAAALRTAAGQLENYERDHSRVTHELHEAQVAAAADQLEAVQAFLDRWDVVA